MRALDHLPALRLPVELRQGMEEVMEKDTELALEYARSIRDKVIARQNARARSASDGKREVGPAARVPGPSAPVPR